MKKRIFIFLTCCFGFSEWECFKEGWSSKWMCENLIKSDQFILHIILVFVYHSWDNRVGLCEIDVYDFLTLKGFWVKKWVWSLQECYPIWMWPLIQTYGCIISLYLAHFGWINQHEKLIIHLRESLNVFHGFVFLIFCVNSFLPLFSPCFDD